MIIEITPVLIKMMLIRGPYDYLMDNQNKILEAKYAIELLKETNGSENGKVETTFAEIYHQPNSIIANEKSKLEVESNLAQAAYKAFEGSVRQHIEKNPDQYVSGIPSKSDSKSEPV